MIVGGRISETYICLKFNMYMYCRSVEGVLLGAVQLLGCVEEELAG